MRLFAILLVAGSMLLCLAACAQEAELAIPGCEPTLSIPPGPAEAAEKLLNAHSYEAAVRSFSDLMQRDPNSESAVLGLTRAYIATNRISEAIALTKDAAMTQPKSARVHVALGAVRFRLGDLVGAEQEFGRARALDPCFGRPYYELYRVEEAASMYASAYSQLKAAYQLSPWDSDVEQAWRRTLSLEERITSTQKFLDRGIGTEEERRAAARHLTYLQARKRGPSRSCRLVTAVDHSAVPLERIVDGPRRTYGWGLSVKLNNRNSLLELDTGASGLTIDPGTAKKAGIKPVADAEFTGIGDGGPVSGYIGYVDSIKIGDLEFQDCLVSVGKTKAKEIENNSSGLIGGDVFEPYLVTIDYPGRKLSLDPLPKRPDSSGRAVTLKLDEDDGVAPATLHNRYIAPSMQTYTPVYRLGHHLMIPTRVNDSAPKLFVIDTGASSNLISLNAAREFARVSGGAWLRLFGVNGEVKELKTAKKVSLQFGSFVQNDIGLVAFDMSEISHDLGVEVAGFLGWDALGQLSVRIDYRDGLVDFEFEPERLNKFEWR